MRTSSDGIPKILHCDGLGSIARGCRTAGWLAARQRHCPRTKFSTVLIMHHTVALCSYAASRSSLALQGIAFPACGRARQPVPRHASDADVDTATGLRCLSSRMTTGQRGLLITWSEMRLVWNPSMPADSPHLKLRRWWRCKGGCCRHRCSVRQVLPRAVARPAAPRAASEGSGGMVLLRPGWLAPACLAVI